MHLVVVNETCPSALFITQISLVNHNPIIIGTVISDNATLFNLKAEQGLCDHKKY